MTKLNNLQKLKRKKNSELDEVLDQEKAKHLEEVLRAKSQDLVLL